MVGFLTMPTVGLWLRLRNVECRPGVQVTVTGWEVNVCVPIVAEATIVSWPALTPGYEKLACPLGKILDGAICVCGLAPITWMNTGVPPGTVR